MSEEKTTGVAWFLWLMCLVGACGLHRLYLGKKASGLFYLCTFGVFGLGQILDSFSMESLVLDANTRPYLPRPTATTTRSKSSRSRLSAGARKSPMVIAITNNFHEAAGKVVTRVKCGYCGNVYPESVRSCTGCGAHLAA
jgi:TM2 domain-containing membrane protein YozV